MISILFICSGNTCRSPMAQALGQRYLVPLEADGIRVASAGTSAVEGAPASRAAQDVLSEMGGDLSGHRSRPAESVDFDHVDLVLTMTVAHADAFRHRFPQIRDRVHDLATFSGLSGKGDIADPFGGDLETYRRTYFEIEEHILAIVPRLREMIGGPDPDRSERSSAS